MRLLCPIFVFALLAESVKSTDEVHIIPQRDKSVNHEQLFSRADSTTLSFKDDGFNNTYSPKEWDPLLSSRNLAEIGIDRCGSWDQIGSGIQGSSPFDYAGTAVSMSAEGDIVAVGAPFHDDNGPNSGQVRVFKQTNNSWNKMGANILGNSAGDHFGSSIALSRDGRTVVIGAPGGSRKAGVVRVFKWNFSLKVWYQVGSDIKGDDTYSEVGSSVAISQSGAGVIVGAKGNGISSFGYTRVYQYSGLTDDWERLGGDIDEEMTGENAEGVSVDLNWNSRYIAIGARANKSNGEMSGYTRVFQLSSSDQWVQVGRSISGDSAFDYSGASVSLSNDGDVIAIGANGSENDTGLTRVYRYSSEASDWEQLGQDLPGDEVNGFSGTSVSLTYDGKALAIGAYGSGRMRGSATLYTYFGSSWRQVGLNLSGDKNYDYSGASVSFSKSGNAIAIGSPFHDGLQGEYCGQTQVFELDAVPCPPSSSPSKSPSIAPSDKPSRSPTDEPSYKPSASPTSKPSKKPSALPSTKPSWSPSQKPSLTPTESPSNLPSSLPSGAPVATPSRSPTLYPSSIPSSDPTSYPSITPSNSPSAVPTTSMKPSVSPSTSPSHGPTSYPSLTPSNSPSAVPTSSMKPSAFPSTSPSHGPTSRPTKSPSFTPSKSPSDAPSISFHPSISPTISSKPSHKPSASPSATPTNVPSVLPSVSTLPSSNPTSDPTSVPTVSPTLSMVPSLQPSDKPTVPKCPCKVLALKSISTGGYDGLTDFSLEVKAFARMIGMELGDGEKQLIFPDKEFSIDGKENFVRLNEQTTTNIVDAKDIDENPVKRPLLTTNGFSQQIDFCDVEDDVCISETKKYGFSGEMLTTLRLEIVEIDAEWWNPDDIIVKDYFYDSWYSDTCDMYSHTFNLDDNQMKMTFEVIPSECPSQSIFR